jgi:serine protease AprX
MEHMLKVYGDNRKRILRIPNARIVAQYPAFLLVKANDAAAKTISGAALTEDITDQYRLEQGGLDIDTSIPRIDSSSKVLPHPAYDEGAKLSVGPHHYIVQFTGPIKETWLNQLRKAGAVIVSPYEGFSVIARLTPRALAKVSKLQVVRWLGHLPYSARLSSHISQNVAPTAISRGPQAPHTRYMRGTFSVQFFRGALTSRAQAAVRRLGFDIVEPVAKSQLLIVSFVGRGTKALRRQLDGLSRVHGVRYVAARPIPRPTNDRAAAIMGTKAALGIQAGLGLSGHGEVIGICDSGLDSGDPADMHPDFAGRILAIKSYPIAPAWKAQVHNSGHDYGPSDINTGHGTHVSGSIAGDGTASLELSGLVGPVRGLSYRAKLVFQAVEQEMEWKKKYAAEHEGEPAIFSGLPSNLKALFAFAYRKGARIHSNSWGAGEPGHYDDKSRQVDEFMWNKPDFCIVFAAGNDGRDGNRDGVIDLGSVTPPGTAKNCITVGASENKRPTIERTYGQYDRKRFSAPPLNSNRMAAKPSEVAAFSSRGPTLDGRVKPDVVAPGTFILSTRSRFLDLKNFGYGQFGHSTLYAYGIGTSMATPLVAGALGAIREYLRKSVGILSPSAALLKATLIAGAVPLRARATPPDNHQGFGRVNLENVLAPRKPLKTLFLERRGVRTGHLDEGVIRVRKVGAPLKVVLAYTDFPDDTLVNNLNLVIRAPRGKIHIGNAGTTATFDHKNNVELVVIPRAPVGDYRIQVIGSNVPHGPQPFAVVIIGAIDQPA